MHDVTRPASSARTIRSSSLKEIDKSSMVELMVKIKELDNLFKFKKIFIDDGGLGAGLVDFLNEDKKIKFRLRPINNKSAGTENKLLKEDIYSNVLNLLSSGKLELVNDEKIINGLKKVEFEYIDGERWKINGTDMSEAISRACWGFKEKNIKPRILSF